MTKFLKNKIKSIKLERDINEYWIADPRLSKDGIEGIVSPIIIPTPFRAEIILNEPLTEYQRDKLVNSFPKNTHVYWILDNLISLP